MDMPQVKTPEQSNIADILKTLGELNERNELQGIIIGGLFRNGEAYTGWSSGFLAQPLYALGVMKFLDDLLGEEVRDKHLRPADSVITPEIEEE